MCWFAFLNSLYLFVNIDLQNQIGIYKNKFAFFNFVDYICI